MKNFIEEYYDIPRNKKVRKSNELIQKSRFNLSLQQQKIILFLISQITPYDEEFKTYHFNIIEFCNICGIDIKGGKSYEELKDNIKAIADKSMWITLPDNKNKETLFRWIEAPVIEKNSGIIELKLNQALKPYLIQLRENFTQYDIVFTLLFKSKYSIRLYELIKSIHYDEDKTFTREFTIDELKALIGAETYKTYQDFKRYALNPAIDEINKTSDKTITYTPIKRGRKFEIIRLTISTKETIERMKVRVIAEKLLDKQITFFDDEDLYKEFAEATTKKNYEGITE